MITAMHIESLCQSCGKRLRVDAQHAGKKARCPACQTIYTVPTESAPSLEPSAAGARAFSRGASGPFSPAAVPQTWQVKSNDGLIYGPVTKDELDRWRDQGRISRRSQLLAPGGQQWMWAADVYPELSHAEPMTPLVPPEEKPGSGRTAAAALHPYYASGIAPHRGPLVLTLSILGIVTVCAVPAIIGIVLGLHDLRLMKAGKMESSGRKLTLAGIVVGAVWTVLNVALLVAGVAVWMMY